MRKTAKWIASQAYGLLTKKRCLAVLAACVVAMLAVGCSNGSEEEEPSPLTISSDGSMVLQCKPDARKAVIPAGVTKIRYNAFSNCALLESVTIPDGVTSIENNAFEGCASLTSVTIPDSVTEIGISAFNGCRSLTSLKIGKGITRIEDYVFQGCLALETVIIPEGVTHIGNYAFSMCKSLTTVTIPRSVDSIWTWAFMDCDSITAVNYPGSSADWDCINGEPDEYNEALETGLEGKTILYDYGQEDSDD